MIRTTKNIIFTLMILALFSLIALYALEIGKADKTAKNPTIANTAVTEKNISEVTSKKTPVKWQVPGAAYRLTIKSTKPELPGYIDLTRYCLPGTITNGIDIRSTTDKKIPFKLFSDDGVLVDATPQDTIKHIYFGFNNPKVPTIAPEKDQVKPDVNNKTVNLAGARLKLTVINGRLNYLTGDEWIKDQEQRITKNHNRREKYYYKSINQYLARGIMPRINFVAMQRSWWDPLLNEQLQAINTNQQYYFSWHPINEHTINISKIRRHNILLYYSLSNYFSNIGWRVRTIKKRSATQKKQLKRLPERVKDAPQKAFIKLFNPKQKRWQRMIRGKKAVNELNLERRPFDARRNFGAIFSGKLIIPQTGEYQFAVNSTSSTILKLDGKNIFTWLGAHNPAPDWGKTIKLNLTAGLHEFKFMYHKASGFTHATVAWQPPGTTAFKMLNENNFAPGWINEPQKCQAADGTTYPLVKRTARKLFFTGKRQRATWTNFKLLSANAADYSWNLNGKKFTNGREIDIAFNSEDNNKITISNSKTGAANLQLKPIPNDKKLLSMNPNLTLKLWLPTFIYDDEQLNGQLEISSGLTEKINGILTIETNRENSILPDSVKNLAIPPKTLPAQQKFAADSTVKNNFSINGQELQSELAVKLSLHIPGMVFANEKVRFIPLKELPEMNFTDGRLTDKIGTLIIPVLHRPSLTELRKWELPLIIKRQLQGIKQLTVIADNFGQANSSFATAITDTFDKYNISVHFKAWHKESNGSAMLSSLPALLPEATTISSDTVMIIPPVTDVSSITSVRVLGRTIATLVERLQQNSHIKKVYLISPFPATINDTERETELIKTLQKLCRTYGTEFIDLNKNIRQLNDWKKAYRIAPDNPAIITVYPRQLTKESADFLMKKVIQ